MNRRPLVMAGVAAALAGVGLAAWQRRSETTVAAAGKPPGAAAAAPTAEAALWDLRLSRPDGTELALATFRGRPLVINFWATWCPPCVKELPEIDQFFQAQAARGTDGWQVVGIAIDKLDAVKAFLAHTPVHYPIALAGYAATDLTRQLGNNVGGLPFTVALNAAGRVVERQLGSTSLAELTGWAQAVR